MSNKRVVLVVLDALKFETACTHMGFMQHLLEQKKVARFEVKGELPSMSRPMYETILTGTPVMEHGIYHNLVNRKSKEQSIFHLLQAKGRTSAAAAYHWVSELYQKSPFQPFEDRIQLQTDLPITSGIFYFEDHYPDSHVYADANFLLEHNNPDFLYIHPMNIDNDGHKYNGDSVEYRNRVLVADSLLSLNIPKWLALGYDVVVTADHGMTKDGSHGGTSVEDRHVPLFILSESVKPGVYGELISQLQIAPLVCHLLQLEPSSKMVPLQLPCLVGE